MNILKYTSSTLINILLLASICMVSASCNKKTCDFIRYDANSGYRYYGKDTVFMEIYFVRYFRHTKKVEKQIDAFACQRFEAIRDSVKKYTLEFYKESKFTNIKYLTEHPKFFYSGNWLEELPSSEKADYLWVYGFSAKGITKGKFFSHNVNQDIKKLYFPILNCESK